ncbi:endonuclease V [Nitrosophilus kaiyonis]|uniref:endonuclease V n=1 Tax=Nitrosophilus kaiyonis TaxID=2930200 RepID=UPI002490A8A1|nr:endonuclease V [Nitrosophilus kaiyonis]
MILIVDVGYKKDKACVVGLEIENFENEKIKNIYKIECKNFAEYIPGKFYKRELPCIIKLIKEYKLNPDIIIIDGYVYLDGFNQKGLGAYLYDKLNRIVKIIGVAKNKYFLISNHFELYRGKSKKPLYITSAGIDFEKAKNIIKNMKGDFRIPNLLKRADKESKDCLN